MSRYSARRGATHHRRTAIVMVAMGLVLAIAAVASGGVPSREIDRDSDSLWVVNASRQAVGRINTSIAALDTAVETETGNVEVFQTGGQVIVADSARARLASVDPARGVLADSVALPAGDVEVHVAGSFLVVHSPRTGAVWVEPVAAMAAFDSSAPPTLSVGARSVLAVDDRGRLTAYSAETGQLYTAELSVSPVRSTATPLDLGEGPFAVTSVGGRWAVLDVARRVVVLADRTVDLSGFIGTDADPVLQHPARAGRSFLVAHSGGIVEVPASAGPAEPSLTASRGRPTSPVSVDGCDYGAWDSGDLWKRCGENEQNSSVGEVSRGDSLEFRVNAGTVALNDSASGASWLVSGTNEGVDDWRAVLDEPDSEAGRTPVARADPDRVERAAAPPVAVDDALGARPGRGNMLPVLLNDSDPNGDALVIESVSTLPETIGRTEIAPDGQRVRLELVAGVEGRVSFSYTVGDGQGGTSSALVEVSVRTAEENSAPAPARPSLVELPRGGRGMTDVLADWLDPDSDPFYLEDVRGAPADVILSEADGTLTISDLAGSELPSAVTAIVSDGSSSGSGPVDLKVNDSAHIRTDAFALTVCAGVELTVAPLEHVHGGSENLRLSSVLPLADASVTVDPRSGVLRFESDTVGTHYVDYLLDDNGKEATGRVRIDVRAPDEGSAAPLMTDHTVFLAPLSSVDVDVLARDRDPAGRVLVVTAVDPLDGELGLTVQIVQNGMLRITMPRPLARPKASVGYTVTNGSAEAHGVVEVVAIDDAPASRPSVAVADAVSVRVGALVDIPVLRNDSVVAGHSVSIDPVLARTVPEGSGLMFVAGDSLRFLAPDEPSIVTAAYRVESDDGQWSTAEVTITVREVDAASNQAPVPVPVTARTYAGSVVTIPIPLAGIDPDGDTVVLLSQDSAPEKGAVVEIRGSEILYRATEGSSGTDRFRYTVVDALGARATGVVSVGIAPATGTSTAPLAQPDSVAARPGSTISVHVLENDIAQDGATVHLSGIEPTDPGGIAVIEGSTISVQVPSTPGRYGFVYTIVDDHGGTGSAFLVVDASEDAPLSRPVIPDSILTLSDVIDRDHIDVDVLAGAFVADGSRKDLRVSVLPSFLAVAAVQDDGSIRVRIAPQNRTIAFAVARADDPSVVSYAFIRVAGRADSLPQVDPSRPQLSVRSGSAVRIDLSKELLVAPSRTVRITDPSTVLVTHSDGSELVVGEHTIEYTSEKGYSGPAALTVEVTDDTSSPPSDERVTTVVLPIVVTDAKPRQLGFAGAQIDLEQGQERLIDLAGLTVSTGSQKTDAVDFALGPDLPEGFDVVLEGSMLRLTARAGTAPGSIGSIPVEAVGKRGTVASGRIDIRVVTSTRPLTVAAPNRIVVDAGESARVDVLADDEATNPFPAVPLVLAEVSAVGRAEPGVSVRRDGGAVEVSVLADAFPGEYRFRYLVLDASGDPGRAVFGELVVVVLGRPSPVVDPRVTASSDRSLTVDWTPGPGNGTDIQRFRLEAHDDASGRLVSAVECVETRCQIPTEGNGAEHAVRITIVAISAVGASDSASVGIPVWSDITPPAPTGLRAAPLHSGVRLEWTAPVLPSGATPLSGYVVTIGARVFVVPGGAAEYSESFVDGDAFPDGVPLAVSVSARNGAFDAIANWQSASAQTTPYGAPISSSVTVESDSEQGAATISWEPFDARGAAIDGYVVQRLTSPNIPEGEQACSVAGTEPVFVDLPEPGGTVAEQVVVRPDGPLQVSFDGLVEPGTQYWFVVWGYNAAGCTASSLVSAVPRAIPPTIGFAMGEMVALGATLDYVVDGVDVEADRYEVRSVDASGAASGTGTPFALGTAPRERLQEGFGSIVAFQLRACSVWAEATKCGDYSPVFSAPSPSLSFEPVDLRFADASWKWAADPPNGELSASYSCGTGDPAVVGTISGRSCAAGGAQRDEWFEVAVGGHAHRFSR